ncbi:MAG TPA: DegQ family serine endoprotease [Thermodesulfobacteriota bacterium]
MSRKGAFASILAALVVGAFGGAAATSAIGGRGGQQPGAGEPVAADQVQVAEAQSGAPGSGEPRGTIAPTPPPPSAPSSFADLVERLEPAVVNIQVTKVAGAQNPFAGTPFEDFFRGRPGPRVQGAGSGFVISPEGYIVTNNHVVEDARDVKVTFATGDEYQAKVIGRDPKTDLALIKIEPRAPLPSVTLGDSDSLRVGDWVLAIGNPFGLEGTVTIGIVSAKSRQIGAGPYDDFLQTDAAINPGNSGGPLFNLKGEVVGINTAIVARGQGVGFAIPINLAKALIPQLREEGRVTRAWLGVVVQPVTPALARSLKLPEAKGALVADLVNDGPAARAGMRQGDVIVGFQGKPVEDSSQLPSIVAGVKPGTRAEVRVIRNGRPETLTVTLGRMPDEEAQASLGDDDTSPARAGLALADVPRPLARQLNLPPGRGALVTAIQAGSPAERAGLQPGDVILEVNRKPVSGAQAAIDEMKRAADGDPILLRVAREGGQIYAALEPRPESGQAR